MTDQDKIDQLEAYNRALVKIIISERDSQIEKYGSCPYLDLLLSNFPDVFLYRKEQEVIEAAIKFSVATSHWELNATGRVLEEAVANLQQARKERE